LIAALAFTGLHKIPGKMAREVIIGCIYVVLGEEFGENLTTAFFN